MKGMRAAAAVVTGALVAAGCTIQRQEAPELSGPSELATSVQLTATPDRLVQDGVSQSVVSALARDHESRPIAGLGLQWSVTASDGQSVVPSAVLSVTDAQGRASTTITAPSAPAQMPSSPVRLVVAATPLGTDTASSTPRTIVVDLVPPAGTPSINRNPVASFTVIPVVATVNQDVTVDASNTTDEGQLCGGRCSYLWDFGDFATASGISTTHRYPNPASYTITLTVVDDRGGVGSTTRSLTVTGPAAPVALFTTSPATPAAGATVTFNASTSTVGAGATITSYEWSFGDGNSASSSASVTTKSYSAAGTYPVTLTITDSLGRRATRTGTVTVS